MNIEDGELQELRAIARLTAVSPDDGAVERLRIRVAGRLTESDALWGAVIALFRPFAAALTVLLIVLALLHTEGLRRDSADLLARSIPVLSADQEIYGD